MKVTDEARAAGAPPDPPAVFETADLPLASFLSYRRFRIEGVRRLNGKTIFLFEDSPPLRVAVLDYVNDSPVAVRSFSATLRDLKAMAR
ncbi:MAG TPA: DUF5659 domain-containing protein [Pyrinomonadaceae bacterium]